MEAMLGSNPSFIWRSLLWSRDILEGGIYWKVGNGMTIRAKKDKWVSKRPSGMILSELQNNDTTKVNELILPSYEWDVKKMSIVLLPIDVVSIYPQSSPVGI